MIIFLQLGQDEQDSGDNEALDDEPPPLNIQTYKQAVQSLEDIEQFLCSRGHAQEAM